MKFDEFLNERFFQRKSQNDLKQEYARKLESKYIEYKRFEASVRDRTRDSDGSFGKFLNFLKYFSKYITKIFELDIETAEKILSTRKYFNETKHGIRVMSDMPKISSLNIYDIREIYAFYNEFCEQYGYERKRFIWKEKPMDNNWG